jgi:regulatory protein
MADTTTQACRITDIQPGRRRGRFNIYIDGEFAVAVGEKVLVDLGLKIGQNFEQDGLRTLALAAERERAMQIALRYLEVRPRSKREIEQRLKRSEIDEELIGSVIAKLQELGFIDDADFASRWIESRNRTRPKSVRSLKAELAVKGISREEIDTAVESISPDDELKLAKAAITKHLGSKRQVPTDKAELDAYNKRLIGFLQRRGFGWTIIKAAMALEIESDGDD